MCGIYETQLDLSPLYGTVRGMARFGYARVSTRGQKDDSQIDALNAAGCEQIWVDKASGKLARRPEWDKCFGHLRRGDELVITRLSRPFRSARHMTELAAALDERGINLIVLKQGIDTTTPAGRFLFHVIAAMDEMTADLISEGTLEGLESARPRRWSAIEPDTAAGPQGAGDVRRTRRTRQAQVHRRSDRRDLRRLP